MKKFTRVAYFSLFLVCLHSLGLFASWNVKLSSDIKWLKTSYSGYVIAMCTDGLHGIDPIKKTEAWACSSIQGIEANGFENIEGSPLVMIKKPNSSKTWILNSVSGQIIFDSEKYGFEKIAQRNMFMERGIFLVEGTIGSDYLLVCIDVEKGTTLWQKRISEKKSLGFTSSLVFRPKPKIDADGHFLYGTDKRLLRINSANGDIMWEKEVKSKIRYIVVPNNGSVMVFSGSVSNALMNNSEENSTGVTVTGNVGSFIINAFKIADGSMLWVEGSKFKSKFSGVVLGDKDFLVFFQSGFNLVDYATGQPKWKDTPKVFADEIGPVLVTDKGIIAATAAYKYFTYISYTGFDGTPIWKKPFTAGIGGVRDLRIASKGVFFIDNDNANILDIITGKPIWIRDKAPEIRNTSATLYDQPNDTYYAFGEGNLVKVQPSQESHTTLARKIKFQGGEVPKVIEHLSNGLLLSSSQNMALVNENGNIVYQQYYPARELTGLAKIGLELVGDIAAMNAARNMASSAIAGGYASYYGSSKLQDMSNDFAKSAATSANIANQAYNLSDKKFSATASSKNRMVMLTTILNDAGQNVPGFVVVDKNTGKHIKNIEIVMANNQPKFAVDPGENKLYKASDNYVICFDLEGNLDD